MKKVAVILCGSGFKDGSEIRESVATLWALSQLAVQVQCFAPDAPQTEVVNCLTGDTLNETRNMRVEAARIARGNVGDLSTLNAKEYDAIILPGGFGAAKNLCSFAYMGSQGSVLPALKDVLLAFHSQNKPIGAICIAPAIVALAFKDGDFQLTVGAAGEVSQEIQKLGHRHVTKATIEACVDADNKIVTTPAYMHDDASIHDVFTGIQKLVNEVVRLA